MPNNKLTTGRLYWQKSGEDSWIDFGNCVDYGRKPRIERLKHVKKENGVGQVDLNLPREVEVLWRFKFDERFGELMRPLWLANTGANITNAGSSGGYQSVVLTPVGQHVVGRVYFLTYTGAATYGVVGIQFATDGVGASLIEGTHYALDRVAGTVTVLLAPNPASPWTLGVGWAAYNQEAVVALGNLLTQGTFKIVEKDTQSEAPFNEENIKGQVYVTTWGDNDGSKFSEYEVEVLFDPGV